jgi:hypothetical protein
VGLTKAAFGSHRELIRMPAQQGTELGFHLSQAIEPSRIEMAHAKIHSK